MTSGEEEIGKIVDKMLAIPKQPDEHWHGEADELLIEAILKYADGLADFLVRPSRQEEIRQQARDLVAAYRAIEKWYA